MEISEEEYNQLRLYKRIVDDAVENCLGVRAIVARFEQRAEEQTKKIKP